MIDPTHKEITEDRYYEMLGVVPPIYLAKLDDQPVNGFAVSEAYDFTFGTVVLSVFYKQDDKFYETLATVRTPKGYAINDTYNHQHMRNYLAKTLRLKVS